MSIQSEHVISDCKQLDSCGAIKMVLMPKDKDLGGFSVRRTLPTAKLKTIGPWIFFDHMGPATFQAGTGIDVRPHPHIGIATVTYLFSGDILHRDSLGSEQSIKPGDINLMVAGRGIVHSERERDEVRNSTHNIEGLQLWLALPEVAQETSPEFHHYPATSIPKTVIDDVSVTVMIGAAYGVESPVKTFSETLYIEAEIKQGQSLVLPNTSELGVYVVKGDMQCRDTHIPMHAMAVFDSPQGIKLTANQNSRIAMVGGKSLGKRYIEWNFVSTSKDRIEEAKKAWQSKEFPDVVGDEKEFIPLP
ncbi:pirin family protein [Pseudoalteromonas shioyasakiensis]|uniref:pirin family protein n=1 Tax=Pseudoalteromonas shioyasakiensis TaxID=1190813 RepID=UPI001C3D3981|nr:pirin family protein [Pseudoalteromonas shioyasakiensis]